MLNASAPSVQAAVRGQIIKGIYEAPSVSTLSLKSVGKCGPLALAGNTTN